MDQLAGRPRLRGRIRQRPLCRRRAGPGPARLREAPADLRHRGLPWWGPTFAVGNLLVVSNTDASWHLHLRHRRSRQPLACWPPAAGPNRTPSMFNGGRLLPGGLGGQRRPPSSAIGVSNPARASTPSVSPPRPWGTRAAHVGIADGHHLRGLLRQGLRQVRFVQAGLPAWWPRAPPTCPGRDEDFATLPLGTWSSWPTIIRARAAVSSPHQAGRRHLWPSGQLRGPPKDGSASQPLTSRVGLTFTDAVDGAGLTPENITIRPVGGQALEGGTPPRAAS